MKGGPYTSGEAADILGIPSTNLRKYCKDGKIKFYICPGTGQHRRFCAESLEDFLGKSGHLTNPCYVEYRKEVWKKYGFNPKIPQEPVQS